MYDPSAFGELVLFLAITSICTIIATLQYERAIVIPDDDRSGHRLVRLTLLLGAASSIIIGVILYLLINIYPALGQSLKGTWYLIPVGVMALASMQTGNFWAIRNGEIGKLATARFLQALTVIAIQLLGIIYLDRNKFLIFGAIAGWLCAATILLFSAAARPPDGAYAAGLKIKETTGRYSKFAIFTMPSMLVTTTAREMPVFILMLAYSKDIVGFYALAYRMLLMPAAIFSKAISQALLVAARQEHMVKRTVSDASTTAFKIALTLSIIPFTGIALLAPDLFGLVFGEKWVTAGSYLSVLAPWAAIAFIASPISILFSFLEKQTTELKLNLFQGLIRTLVLGTAFIFKLPHLVLTFYSLASIIGYSLMIYILMDMSGVDKKLLLGAAGRDLIYAAALVGICSVVWRFAPFDSIYIVLPIVILSLLKPLFQIIDINKQSR